MPPTVPESVPVNNQVPQPPVHSHVRSLVITLVILIVAVLIFFLIKGVSLSSSSSYNSPVISMAAIAGEPVQQNVLAPNPINPGRPGFQHLYYASGATYRLRSYRGWAQDEVCLMVSEDTCTPVTGISSNLNEFEIYTDKENVYLYAYNPSSDAKGVVNVIYLLKGTTATEVGGNGFFTETSAPGIYQTSAGVYVIPKTRFADRTLSTGSRLEKLEGLQFITVQNIDDYTSGRISVISNNTGDVYLQIGLSDLYLIKGTQAQKVHIPNDYVSITSLSYVGGSWCLIINNNGLAYKLEGVTATLVKDFLPEGYNEYNIISNEQDMYLLVSKIVPGFCGDENCRTAYLYSLSYQHSPVKLVEVVGYNYIVNDGGGEGAYYIDARKNMFLYNNGTLYKLAGGTIAGKIPNVPKYPIMHSDSQNTYLTIPTKDGKRESFRLDI